MSSEVLVSDTETRDDFGQSLLVLTWRLLVAGCSSSRVSPTLTTSTHRSASAAGLGVGSWVHRWRSRSGQAVPGCPVARRAALAVWLPAPSDHRWVQPGGRPLPPGQAGARPQGLLSRGLVIVAVGRTRPGQPCPLARHALPGQAPHPKRRQFRRSSIIPTTAALATWLRGQPGHARLFPATMGARPGTPRPKDRPGWRAICRFSTAGQGDGVRPCRRRRSHAPGGDRLDPPRAAAGDGQDRRRGYGMDADHDRRGPW